MCLQGIGGRQAVISDTKPVNFRRYVANFNVENTTKGDSGHYRCIGQSERGVGVSSYAELTVKRASDIPCWLQGLLCLQICSLQKIESLFIITN